MSGWAGSMWQRAAGLVLAGIVPTAVLLASNPAGWPDDGWVSYKVPLNPGQSSPCCYSDDGKGDFQRGGCFLDGANSAGSRSIRFDDAGDSDQLRVYVELADGHARQIEAYGADCPLKGAEEVRDLGSMPVRQSVEWLREQVESLSDSRDGKATKRPSAENAAMAIAMHAGKEAQQTLQQLSDVSRPMAQRKMAVFWLGQRHGDSSAEIVADIAAHDASAHMRSHAVFSLSQSDAGFAYDRLREVAERDDSGKVRGDALFWMAQSHPRQAAVDVRAALRREQEPRVQDAAVFALSQLGDEAVPSLVSVIEGDYPRELKKRALFWLGQSDEPQAQDFLERVFDRDIQ